MDNIKDMKQWWRDHPDPKRKPRTARQQRQDILSELEDFMHMQRQRVKARMSTLAPKSEAIRRKNLLNAGDTTYQANHATGRRKQPLYRIEGDFY